MSRTIIRPKVYMGKRPKDTRYRYRETRKTAEALLMLEYLYKDDDPTENASWIDRFIESILKFCCFMCGVKYDEKQM